MQEYFISIVSNMSQVVGTLKEGKKEMGGLTENTGLEDVLTFSAVDISSI